MNRTCPTILIADDHVMVADACKKLLEPEFDVVGVVADGRTLIQSAAELHPDVIILDIAMPQLNGLDAGEQVKQKNRSVKLIYMTMNPRPDVAAEAFRRGASAYVLKQCSASELAVAVRRALRNQSYISPLITRDTVEFLLRSGTPFREEKRLTSRQAEVLQLLAEGKAMKEVAYLLNLKPRTVAFHKYAIMSTLGIKTNAELMQYAIRRQMVA